MTAAAETPESALPNITSNDRLGFLLVFSTIIHTFIVLTLGFTIATTDESDLPPTLEVVLVQQKTDEAPDEAKVIANEDNTGGGTTDEASIRSNPFKAPFQSNEANVALRSGNPARQEPVPDTLQILSADQARREAFSEDVEQQKKRIDSNPAYVDQLIQEIEASNDVIDREMKELAERPKREYVSTRTKKHRFAAYMKAWEAKVERTGNMNYPRRVKGEVMMNVGIARNGTIESIKVLKTLPDGTREAILHDAAKRVIKLASPFAPFSPEMGDVDILHIVRTYVFNGETFTTR